MIEAFDAGHGPWVELCHRIGVDAVEGVMDTFGGLKVHVPKSRVFWADLLREIRNHEIRARHNGRNIRELVLQFRLSERQVRNILLDGAAPRESERVRVTSGGLVGGHGG